MAHIRAVQILSGHRLQVPQPHTHGLHTAQRHVPCGPDPALCNPTLQHHTCCLSASWVPKPHAQTSLHGCAMKAPTPCCVEALQHTVCPFCHTARSHHTAGNSQCIAPVALCCAWSLGPPKPSQIWGPSVSFSPIPRSSDRQKIEGEQGMWWLWTRAAKGEQRVSSLRLGAQGPHAKPMGVACNLQALSYI